MFVDVEGIQSGMKVISTQSVIQKWGVGVSKIGLQTDRQIHAERWPERAE